jgi:hypothetical protein
LSSDPGWTGEGLWAWGQPTGDGGEHGYPDPTSGYSGDNVYGYNLAGDYEDSLPERHLTSTALDCSDLTSVELRFWRWLGVERAAYDHAYVRVSNDGVNWQTVWENAVDTGVEDSSWTLQAYDISAVADGQPTVFLRWTMGSTDGSWHYCGWNIDDVEIWAVAPQYDLGDVNCDGLINGFDIDPFVMVVSGNLTAYYASYPDCDHLLADVNEDGSVNGFDIDPFVTLIGGG